MQVSLSDRVWGIQCNSQVREERELLKKKALRTPEQVAMDTLIRDVRHKDTVAMSEFCVRTINPWLQQADVLCVLVSISNTDVTLYVSREIDDMCEYCHRGVFVANVDDATRNLMCERIISFYKELEFDAGTCKLDGSCRAFDLVHLLNMTWASNTDTQKQVLVLAEAKWAEKYTICLRVL